MIRKLGFTFVSEVSFGVDLVAMKYKDLFERFRGKYHISANCPAVVSFIEKYYPELTINLAPIASPMIATAKVIRKKYGQNIRIIFIGPCIATKEEAMKFQGDAKIDAVLTFIELRQLFEEFNIRESHLESRNLIHLWVIKVHFILLVPGSFSLAESMKTCLPAG
jgi:iron only hydrogenase large subunit-like protein